MKQPMMKKVAVTGLALAIMLSGGTAAFAKGNNDDDRNDNNNHGDKRWGKPAIAAKGNVQMHLKFDDMDKEDVKWALRYIASLASKQVFEGYEDGTFKPYNNVSRIEAIAAAVRLMGLRDQAESAAEKQTQLNFKDAKEVPAWAVGYVAVAAEHNLFAESDNAVQANKPADRLWATTLLVKALKLDGEAQAKMNTKLTFKDADKIPAGAVGYIAVAVERGLVNGFEDNTFRPGQPVTRAQIAALLDRTGTQMPDSNNDAATGAVASAVYNNTLTLTNNGQTLSYTLNANTFVFRGGAQATAAELQAGDQVRVRTMNGVVVYIEVVQRSDNQQTLTIDGTFSYYNVNNDMSIGQIVIQQTTNGVTSTNVYNVSKDAKIEGNAQLLTNGHAIQLQGKDNLVTKIIVK